MRPVRSAADRSAAGPSPVETDETEALAARVGERRATRRGRDTQRRLIAAAHELFDTTPFHETRIADIARRAGVSAGSFYTYFASKEALFQIVAQHVLEEMFSAPRRDPDNEDGNPVRDIAYASRSYFEVCLKHRVVAQSIERLRTVDPRIGASRRNALSRGVKRTARWVRRLQDEGLCDPELDPWYTALVLQSMNVSVAYDQLVHREEPDDIDALVAAVTPIWARAVGLDAWL